MKMYKVVTRPVKDKPLATDFMTITDAIIHMMDLTAHGNKHVELYSAEIGCKYDLLFVYDRED